MAEGDGTCDLRTRVLNDVKDLVMKKRDEGLRPIIMMDANDQWTDKGSKTFQAFITSLNLYDPLHKKYATSLQQTYVRGPRRLDYFLVCRSFEPAIEGIGTLGQYEGLKYSDHVFLLLEYVESQYFSKAS